jgi:YbbR domain-containing protein
VKIKPFENLTLKLVAIILAVMIWFLVVGEKRSEVRYTVPIEFRNLAEQLELVQQSVTQVEVTVRGFSSVVKRLTVGDIDVHIDLNTVKEGTNSFVLSSGDITVPIGTTVIQVSPSDVSIVVDSRANKLIPIKPVTRGVPGDGYILGDVTVEPGGVTVTGAQTLLKATSKIETEAIAVDNMTEDIVKKVKVRLPNGLRIEKEEAQSVSVRVKVVPKMVDLFFDDIPLHIEGETRSVTLSPQSISALVNGPELKISKMLPPDIAAFIETTQLPDGQSVVQPTFKLPESVTVKRYYPKTITITLTRNN